MGHDCVGGKFSPATTLNSPLGPDFPPGRLETSLSLVFTPSFQVSSILTPDFFFHFLLFFQSPYQVLSDYWAYLSQAHQLLQVGGWGDRWGDVN